MLNHECHKQEWMVEINLGQYHSLLCILCIITHDKPFKCSIVCLTNKIRHMFIVLFFGVGEFMSGLPDMSTLHLPSPVAAET